MKIEDLRKALEARAKDTGTDPEAVERLALNLVLAMPVDARKELADITVGLDEGGWNFAAQKAARVALVAVHQALGGDTRTPPRIPPSLTSRPQIREMFWCDFPEDAQLPEFWKTRPVLVVSYKQNLAGCVTVVPCSSQEQEKNPWAIKLSKSLTEGQATWAVCDKPTTVAVSRLSANKGKPPRLSPDEFHKVLKLVLEWLPTMPEENHTEPEDQKDDQKADKKSDQRVDHDDDSAKRP